MPPPAPLRLAAAARQALALPDRVARALLLRDLDAWLRLQFLGVAARTGVADALRGRPRPADFRMADPELLEAFLRVGVALGEVRERGGRFAIKGRRLRAVAGRSRDLRGLAEEVVFYDSPIYRNLGDHLQGAPPGDYLRGLGSVIADASRLAEPLLAPVVRQTVSAVRPGSVLDVGCGSGLYLRHVLEAAPDARVVGIDIDPDVVADVAGADVRRADLFDELPGPFDLVLLLQNVYYWPPHERPRVLARLRELSPEGTAVVATALAAGPAFNHHLDLVLRVTEGNWRLPTRAEIVEGLHEAGFARVDAFEPVPKTGFLVAVAS